jgi:MOSC domain-containing protein YiiM
MAPPARARGVVRQVNLKAKTSEERGLPKASVPEATITASGLAGDFNRYRHEEKHDDPDMALLLIPVETIEQLGREGWPVRAGDLGENITSEGLDYEAFVPGSRFRIGAARVQISKACTPCDNLYLLPYVGAARGPEFMKLMMGRRGWYARVLKAGRVRVGDPIARESHDDPTP